MKNIKSIKLIFSKNKEIETIYLENEKKYKQKIQQQYKEIQNVYNINFRMY